MARRSVRRDRSQRHPPRRRLRRGRGRDGAQVLRRRDRSAAIKLAFNIRWWIHRARLDLLGARGMVAPDRIRHTYEDLASYQLIDSNLAGGNPVIVRVRLASGVTHFVVIAGKDGFDYLVRDPGAGSAKGLYPLRELGSDIEGLRFYEPIDPSRTGGPSRTGINHFSAQR